MKKLLILLLLVTIQFSFGQNRMKPSLEGLGDNDHVIFNKEYRMTSSNMSIIDQSNISNSEKGFFYLLEVKNTSKKIKNYNLKVESFSCDNHKEHSDINFSFYNTSKTSQLKELVLQPGESTKFYVKSTVPKNAKLSSWNCSNILLYNPITNEREVTKLVSQVQDAKNVH